MSKTAIPNLSGVTESLFITLYIRAMESQRPDALIKDEKAEALVRQLSYDFGRFRLFHLREENKLVIVLCSQQFDCCTRDFLMSHSNAVVVNIGCGLDTCFERVNNGQVKWYDLDLPHVIELRRQLIGGEKDHYHLLDCSVLENIWLDQVSAYRLCPILFLAEGVFMYFEEAQVKWLVLTLRDHFPSAHLVFDAYSPIRVLRSNLQTVRFGLRTHWGIWHRQELKTWGDWMRLLDKWGHFDTNEPRLAPIRWLCPIEGLARSFRIYHFRLCEAAG